MARVSLHVGHLTIRLTFCTHYWHVPVLCIWIRLSKSTSCTHVMLPTCRRQLVFLYCRACP